MQPLSTRTEHFTDSVIRRMTRVSAKYGAINLSQGYPDFNPPSAILDRLAEVIRPVLDANKEDLGQHVELNV